jgi:predicted ATPase
VVSEALASAGGREDGQRWYAPELLRIKAEILLRQSADQSALAEDCLEQAATMAREQGALTWELRIALSLARLGAAQDHRDEARQILAPVYDRFTEGFKTRDLRAANAFLHELPG